MCRTLSLSRSTYYYEAKMCIVDTELVAQICEIFEQSRNNYGARKIKRELAKEGICASRRRIGRIMKEQGLVSNYTVKVFKPQKTEPNEAKTGNRLNRQFDNQPHRKVVVSDLTYVRVVHTWNYVCTLVDLFNREIIGVSAGRQKTADLVKEAFASVKGDLSQIEIFHTDQGSEFNNQTIQKILSAFSINRSLSKKGCPYDNAVAEATFKIFKIEFIKCKLNEGWLS